MIFVTVGMHNQGFDRLIEKCDLLAGQIEDKMIIQKGSTSYCPRNAEYFDFASNEEFLKLIRQSISSRLAQNPVDSNTLCHNPTVCGSFAFIYI